MLRWSWIFPILVLHLLVWAISQVPICSVCSFEKKCFGLVAVNFTYMIVNIMKLVWKLVDASFQMQLEILLRYLTQCPGILYHREVIVIFLKIILIIGLLVYIKAFGFMFSILRWWGRMSSCWKLIFGERLLMTVDMKNKVVGNCDFIILPLAHRKYFRI